MLPYPNPINTFDQSTLSTSQKTPVQYSFSLGTGIWWGQIKLDAAYTFTALTIDDGIGQNRNRNSAFSLGFTGVF